MYIYICIYDVYIHIYIHTYIPVNMLLVIGHRTTSGSELLLLGPLCSNFSRVSTLCILCGKFSSELTFENFYMFCHLLAQHEYIWHVYIRVRLRGVCV